jgi:hypothetical protein
VARRSAPALSERGTRDDVVRRRLSGRRREVPTAPLRRACGAVRRGAGAWQPRGDGMLIGGPLMSAIYELKFTPG